MDLKGIPKTDFESLSSFLGEKDAYEYLKKRKFNYQAVVMKILRLQITTFLKRKPFYYTIILIIVAIVFLLLMFPDLFFF